MREHQSKQHADGHSLELARRCIADSRAISLMTCRLPNGGNQSIRLTEPEVKQGYLTVLNKARESVE